MRRGSISYRPNGTPGSFKIEWLALRGVYGGDMAQSAGVYLVHGRPVPGDLTPPGRHRPEAPGDRSAPPVSK